MSREDAISSVQSTLSEEGMTLYQLFQELGKSADLFNMSEGDYADFSALFEKLSAASFASRKEKGDLLEEMVSVLFRGSENPILTVRRNCRTSTNEIDLLLEWTDYGKCCGADRLFSCFGESFLCECKNYSDKVSVTYVGKFYSLLSATNTKFGIVIAWDGISGRGPWDSSRGLIKKFALAEQRFIVPIDKNDLERIYKKETNIYKIARDKYLATKNDISYDKYIKPHEAENNLIS